MVNGLEVNLHEEWLWLLSLLYLEEEETEGRPHYSLQCLQDGKWRGRYKSPHSHDPREC